MQRAAKIIGAGEAQSESLADVLADAFAADPVLNWMIPEPALYPEFFRLIIRDTFLPAGIMHLESEARGAALWLPPGRKLTVAPSFAVIRLFARLLLRSGPRPLLRVPQQGRLFERHHPVEPHYHLVFVGARQAAQGRGVGSALLKQGTRICDQQHMPAYLESSNEKNVPLYQRHGFEVIAQENLPGGGPPAWFMWRAAR
jgi:GNAT superfamily N-acetyltransferase